MPAVVRLDVAFRSVKIYNEIILEKFKYLCEPSCDERKLIRPPLSLVPQAEKRAEHALLQVM